MTPENTPQQPKTAPAAGQKRPSFGGNNRGGGRRPGGNRRGRDDRGDQEFDNKVLEVSRVTRVTEGGKRMSFRAVVAVGDRINRVGVGIGKALDVSLAVNKAIAKGKKQMIRLPLTKTGSIPHEVSAKFASARVLLKPAPVGTGIVVGGVMRTICELGGVKNVTGKMKGSNNKINNAMATLDALKQVRFRAKR